MLCRGGGRGRKDVVKRREVERMVFKGEKERGRKDDLKRREVKRRLFRGGRGRQDGI